MAAPGAAEGLNLTPKARAGCPPGSRWPYTAATRSPEEPVLDSHLRRPAPAALLLACLLLAAGLRPLPAADLAGGFTLGGSLAVTSNYIYRGVSESNGHAAVQADLHAESSGGTFLGAWGSTRDHDLDPYTDFDLEIYLGQRFKLSNAWSAALSARGHYFVGGGPEGSTDYEQLAGSLTYLDRWTLSLAAIPNATHYWSAPAITMPAEPGRELAPAAATRTATRDWPSSIATGVWRSATSRRRTKRASWSPIRPPLIAWPAHWCGAFDAPAAPGDSRERLNRHRCQRHLPL
jgi:hypothetical protein